MLFVEGAEIENSNVMDYSKIGKGAKHRHDNVDRHNVNAPNTLLSNARDQDAARYHVSPGGFGVLPHGKEGFVPFY